MPQQTLFGFAIAVVLFAVAPAVAAPPEPPAKDKRVLIVSIDGLRPDLLIRAKAPNVRALLERGSYTFWAQTVPESYTLPAHVSMVTGVTPARHGVTWNNHIEGAYSQVPTLFTLAKKAGLRTAIAVGKTKFVALTPPESLDWKFQPMDEPVKDAEVARAAVGILREHRPEVLFVHFASPDDVGHAHGWGSAEQLRTIEAADAALGSVLATLDELKLRESTLIILTSDHGGFARVHDPPDPRVRYIPWIAAGPGVRKGADLTAFPKLQIRIEDTFATACAFLGINPGAGLDGRAVAEIFENVDLLTPAPANLPARK